jgi:RNA polymerase sigma factor (sigma-70 family)
MEIVYKQNLKTVYKYLFCLTHNVEISEELTQETFYQATYGINKFRGDCKISVWLCQIAKRLWYKELEKKKHKLVPFETIDTDIQSPENIERDYLISIEKVELLKLLHNFDETTREVMYLRLMGELSFAEIGDIMGRKETWARVTFYRGKQKLVKGRE